MYCTFWTEVATDIYSIHYNYCQATFVTTLLAFYATYAKLDILKKRIFSPFIPLLSIVWLQIGPAFEIAQHVSFHMMSHLQSIHHTLQDYK